MQGGKGLIRQHERFARQRIGGIQEQFRLRGIQVGIGRPVEQFVIQDPNHCLRFNSIGQPIAQEFVGRIGSGHHLPVERHSPSAP